MATPSFSFHPIPNFTKISFSSSSSSTLRHRQIVPSLDLSTSSDGTENLDCRLVFDRRQVLLSSVGVIATSICNAGRASAEFADMPALRGKDYGKTKMRLAWILIESNKHAGFESWKWFHSEDRRYSGGKPVDGLLKFISYTSFVDWDGYTIGYYGRIFEARNKTKGGSFEGGDKDFFKFRVGSQEVIPAFEEAITGIALGGIRRIIVPPELGYPDYDYDKKGPRPTTFSGQRALSFVLRNQGLIDKTLLFDIELLKIIPN
ncbi:hypothetical protein H5410_056900 [Solanum commersonii]|uniref:peptidylprolyl isomerase n=1 Tax=Solanum commersonii TaxID=4109 RepID=A0A9J5WPD4_SOLCO|nr:hypothetical protein H5410_056900 [Solanum commersonii]